MRTTNVAEKLHWIANRYGWALASQFEDSPEAIEHYYTAFHDYDLGVCDADDWAWLNTLFRYDIGVYHACAIINWYYENYDTTVMEEVSVDQKETLRNICEKELGINLDFSHWPEEEPKYLQFGFKQYYEED